MSEVRYKVGYQAVGNPNHFELDMSFEDVTDIQKRWDYKKAHLSESGRYLRIDIPCGQCTRYRKVEDALPDCTDCPFEKLSSGVDGIGCFIALSKVARGEGAIKNFENMERLLSVGNDFIEWEVVNTERVLLIFKAIDRILFYAQKYNTMHKYVFDVKPTITETVEAETVEQARAILRNYYKNPLNAGKIKVYNATEIDIRFLTKKEEDNE
jgi:hypothetical protein